MAANNGRLSHRMGGNRPSFLLISLCIVIVILLYSYWSLSSRNTLLLQDITLLRTRLGTLLKESESKKRKHASDMASLSNERDSLKEKVKQQRQKESDAVTKTSILKKELLEKSELLDKMQKDEVQNRKEVQHFKESINSTSKKFNLINERAGKVARLAKELKTNNSELQEKIKILESQLAKYKNSKNLEARKKQTSKTGQKVDKTSDKQNRHTRILTTIPSEVKRKNAGEKNSEANKTVKSVKASGNITIPLRNETEEAQRNVSKTSSETSASHENSKNISEYARGANVTVASPREFGSVSSEAKGLGKMTATGLSDSKGNDKHADMGINDIRSKIKRLRLQKNRNTAFQGAPNYLQRNPGFNSQRGRERSHAADGPDNNRVNEDTTNLQSHQEHETGVDE